MADVCPSHDNRLNEAAHWCPAAVAATRALITSAISTNASVGAGCTAVGSGAEI